MRHLHLHPLLALVPVFLALAPSHALDRASGAKKDSLRTLHIIISSELEERNKVLLLKDRGFTDSLMRNRLALEREGLDRLLADSALAVEVKTREEFGRHWKEIEDKHGFQDLRGQYAARDFDKSRIPRLILKDSSVVVYPGWIIFRRKISGRVR